VLTLAFRVAPPYVLQMRTCFIHRVRVRLLAITLLLSPSICVAEKFRIDPARSTITFKVRQYLGTVTGRFQQFSGEIELDREQPERSTVNATIQVRSIKTGIAKRDEHLLSPDFFNAAKYPEITFKNRRVKLTGKEAGDITGDFTMHGVTRPITLHVRFLGFAANKAGGQTTRWRVTTEPIKRDDYALRWSDTTESISMIAQNVAVEIEIEATPSE
jgi:polyisoprenoid-binding protein YceI